MGHGLRYITFHDQKYIAPLAMCYNPPLVRDKPLGAPAFVKLVYWNGLHNHQVNNRISSGGRK